MPTKKTTAAKPAKSGPKAKADAVKAKVEKVPAREAAKLVLIEAGRPMHYREITQKALEQGIIRVRGGSRRKPDPDKALKTIRSFLAGSVQQADSEFVRVDSGVFDLKTRASKATAAAEKVAAKAEAKA